MSENLDRNPELKTVATYRRTIGASLDRVWENVLDWEHLPYVHSGSFADIQCDHAGEWGWRATIRSPGGDDLTNIELLTDRLSDRYVTRVLDGPGAGGEVWTTVAGVEAHATDIVVEFCAHVPDGVAPESLGDGYLALYDRLWSEDEQMMQQRQLELDRKDAQSPASSSSAPVDLGSEAEVRAGIPLRVEAFGTALHVIDVDGELIVHSLVCPHQLGPLDNAVVKEGEVECPWHGYRFDVRTGRSCDGRRLRLATPARLEIEAGRVRLVTAAKGESEDRSH